MKDPAIEFEGTWDDIKRQMPDFDGKQLKVTVRVASESTAKRTMLVQAALEQIWESVPLDSWDRFPADFADDMDRYLYRVHSQA